MDYKPTYKFSDYDALCIGKLVQKRRPGWSWNGIMNAIERAAMSGASLGQVTSAADLATRNKNATTPASILWDEHINASAASQPKVQGSRVCGECAHKKPLESMTRTLSGIWLCDTCKENNA